MADYAGTHGRVKGQGTDGSVMMGDLQGSFAWVLTAQVGQFMGMLSFGAVADRYGRRRAFSAYSLLTAAALAPPAPR